MTEKELNITQDGMRRRGCSKYHGTALEKQKCWELGCIDMINSILAYSYRDDPFFSAETIMRKDEDLPYPYLAEYVKALGRYRVVELIQEQLNDIKGVECNAFTDE